MFTQLKDRKLYFDGDIVASKEYLYNRLLSKKSINFLYIDEIDDEINNYNKLPDKNINYNYQLSIKNNLNKLNIDWNIPISYKELNIDKFIIDKFKEEIKSKKLSKIQIDQRLERISLELNLWEKFNLLNLLKTLIYIVDIFKENNVVWGTGRGSSCCCYILYLIELHNVDSIKYNLDIKEFFRNK